MGEQPVADAEAPQAVRADAGLSAFAVEVVASFQRRPARASAASVGSAHVGQANACDLV